MNHRDHDFDAHARSLHHASLRQLSPQTLARLRGARTQAQTAGSTRRWPWLAATAFTGLLAIGLGAQFLPAAKAPTGEPAQLAAQAAATDANGSVTLLDENPDLYLWLASSEAQPLAME